MKICCRTENGYIFNIWLNTYICNMSSDGYTILQLLPNFHGRVPPIYAASISGSSFFDIFAIYIFIIMLAWSMAGYIQQIVLVGWYQIYIYKYISIRYSTLRRIHCIIRRKILEWKISTLFLSMEFCGFYFGLFN